MNPQDAIDFSREAIKTCMMVGGPILLASLLIGLLVGVVQAMTQVQDQAVSFVPKILLLIVMIGLCLPWLTDQMLEFARHSFETPMTQWAGTSTASQSLFSQPASASASQIGKSKPSDYAPARLASVSSLNLPKPSLGSSKTDSNSAPIQSSGSSEPNQNSLEVQQTPEKSPFILPHYRMIRSPKSNTGG